MHSWYRTGWQVIDQMTDYSSAGLAEDVDKDKLISFWQKEKKKKKCWKEMWHSRELVNEEPIISYMWLHTPAMFLVLNLWSTACSHLLLWHYSRPVAQKLDILCWSPWSAGRKACYFTLSVGRFSSLLPLLGFAVWPASGSLGVSAGNGSRFVAN